MELAQELHHPIPTRDEARRRHALRWIGPLPDREWLWHLNGRTVATGAALGAYFGLIAPAPQMPFAAGGAPFACLAVKVVWRLHVVPQRRSRRTDDA
jgi:hypothetical protein